MTLATLSQVLQPALREGYAVAGLVCLGWEDMRTYVEAAEAEECPVILQAGPSCRRHTPLPVLAKMFLHLAQNASVPVVAHLDHGYTEQECRIALDCGFTSIMFDGSRKSLSQNIEETAAIAQMAHAVDASCEGEVGFVGYSGGDSSVGTSPEAAARFAGQTGVDAMAISIGNVHMQTEFQAGLDEARLRAIEALTQLPLVIHGGSGVPPAQRSRLAQNSNICKFNIGTELRMVFGDALRKAVNSNPNRFDRIEILGDTHEPVSRAARHVLKGLKKQII